MMNKYFGRVILLNRKTADTLRLISANGGSDPLPSIGSSVGDSR